MSLTVSELGLVGQALAFASALYSGCPAVVFTSGRRTREAQAAAMARNVLAHRQYIESTYASSIASRACQAWIDAHPEVLDLDGVAEGLLGILLTLTDAEYSALTHHGAGEALDIKPWSCPRTLVMSLVNEMGGKFLDHEASLKIWHVEFRIGHGGCT